ncbi:ATP-binding protein [Levilactobacillus fujinensis]|uniref:ATP-binding protein n=1 Tax=Levilactobacillus fujinensis TaxID=2486024 RepID=A0ABW1TKT5_9LACO|nr:ATP-binding protein [Levilactobacillus fujinensis]
MAWSWSEEATDALNDWFTPSMPAVKNYVGRGNLDRTIMREFAQRGRQVLVYGPTGAGKTSMVLDNLKKLEKSHGTKSIRVTMSNTTTIESFIADVAGRLRLSRVVQRIQTNEDGVQAEAKAGLRWFSLRAEVQSQSTNQNITEQYMGNDDFAILEEVLFKRNTVLIVDDMENLSGEADSLRVRLAEIAKNMSDDAVNYENSYAKIVFVGIAETAKELWHDVQSLRSRLATIAVP